MLYNQLLVDIPNKIHKSEMSKPMKMYFINTVLWKTGTHFPDQLYFSLVSYTFHKNYKQGNTSNGMAATFLSATNLLCVHRTLFYTNAIQHTCYILRISYIFCLYLKLPSAQ